MELFPPIAVIDITAIFSGILQFVLVVGISFALISLITSFVRFQVITGDIAGVDTHTGMSVKAANTFQVEVLRRLAGSRTMPPPFSLFHIGLKKNDMPNTGGDIHLVHEIEQHVYDEIKAMTRNTDAAFRMEDHTVSLILGGCIREKVANVASRLIRDTYNKLYRSGSGWSGHVAVHTGCVSYPENGKTMQALIEALESVFVESESDENHIVLADVPVEVDPDEEEADDEDEKGQEAQELDEEDDEEDDEGTANPLVDPLTGVMKAGRIDTAMQKYMAALRRAGEPVAMLLVSIDRIAKYHKQYGEEVEGAMLATLGTVLQQVTRETDLLGRYEDTDFIVMLDCSVDNALLVARRICAAVRKERFDYRNMSLRMTVSAGVAGFPEHGRTPRDLLLYTQAANLESQERGGDMSVMYDRSLKVQQVRKQKPKQLVDRF